MKRLNRWLLPVLSCLVILAAILLPQRLSLWRDRVTLNGFHTEEIKTEYELPIQSLTPEERVLLLAEYIDDMTSVTAIVQETELSDGAEDLLRTEFDELCSNGILRPEAIPGDLSFFKCRQLYLRMPEESRTAGFLIAEGYDKSTDINYCIALDGETGHTLLMEVNSTGLKISSGTPVDIGTAFLRRLGTRNTCTDADKYNAAYELSGAACCYSVWLDDPTTLWIFPVLTDSPGFTDDSEACADR